MFYFSCVLSLPQSVSAQVEDLFYNRRIEDRAGAISARDEVSLEELLNSLKTDIEILVLIEQNFREISEHNRLFEFGDAVYADWQSMHPTDEDAIIFILDLTEGMLIYDTSVGIGDAFGSEIQILLADVFVQPIRQGRYADGFREGIHELDKLLSRTQIETELEPMYEVNMPISKFAYNVIIHVLYHEMAHALIREFGLPVLANEEAMADSFATSWITLRHYDDAPNIIIDRVRSWIHEDQYIDPIYYDFKSEHPLDIRRAYQAACLFYGADPAEWRNSISWLEFTQHDLSDCSDTAPDQIDSWANILRPHQLSSGQYSNKVEIIYGEGPMKHEMQVAGLLEGFAGEMRRFDWPKNITIHFDHCDAGASWNRAQRTILLCDDYVMRFIAQGETMDLNP